jgi:hypothetical protein
MTEHRFDGRVAVITGATRCFDKLGMSGPSTSAVSV